MWWLNTFIVLLFLQSLLITNIHGNANRRRRRQTSGSLYGTNSYLGASAPAGYNRPASATADINGIKLNYLDARDMYGNPLIASSNTDSSLNSVDLNSQPRPQQQQLYGTNDQASLNTLYSGNSFYSGAGSNQFIRDSNGNMIPSGAVGSSFYSSSNTQQAYPPNSNQVLMNKDLYGTFSNPNNNQYGYNNNNQLPNSNTYGGQMGSGNNMLPNRNTYGGQMGTGNNMLPNSNTYGGQMGAGNNFLPTGNAYGGQMGGGNNMLPNSNTYGKQVGTNNNYLPNSNTYGGPSGGNNNLIPNTNTYSGIMGTDSNTNRWSNTNNYNQNAANPMYPNKDTSYNTYGNPNSFYYGYSSRLTISYFLLFLSFITMLIFQ